MNYKHNISIITFIKFILPFALAWSIINTFFEHYIAASITFLYVLVSFGIILYSYTNNRDEILIVRIQMLLILLLPFFMMWNLGGFENGSNIIIWAFLAPIMALLYTEKKRAKLLVICIFIFTDSFSFYRTIFRKKSS